MIKHIPSLTPLRGIASIMVMMFHYNLRHPLLPEGYYLFSKFYLMVDLFFILSGFIMIHVYSTAFEGGNVLTKFFRFLQARFARVYPLHLFTFLCLLLCVVLLKHNDRFPIFLDSIFSNKSIPLHLTLTQSWGFIYETTWNIPSWSISVEWFLYMVFPLLLFWYQRFDLQRIHHLISYVAGVGMIALIYYYLQPFWLELRSEAFDPANRNIDVTTTWIALARGLSGFLIGMSMYYLYISGFLEKLLKYQMYFYLVVLLLLSLWLFNVLPDPLAIALFPLLIFSSIYSIGGHQKILNGRVFTFLGEISYSIYLVHSVLLLFNVFYLVSYQKSFFTGWFDETSLVYNWIGLLLYAFLTFVVSLGTYYGIEKPFRKILRPR